MLHNQLAQTATQINRSNQTSEQYNNLEAITAENAKMVEEIESRFRPVLREIPPCPVAAAGVSGPPQEYLVPLANGLRGIYETAMRTQQALRSILERAEI